MTMTVSVSMEISGANAPAGGPDTIPFASLNATCYTTSDYGGTTSNNDPISVTGYPPSIPVDYTQIGAGGNQFKYCFPQYIQADVEWPGGLDGFSVKVTYQDPNGDATAIYGNPVVIVPVVPPQAVAARTPVAGWSLAEDAHRRPVALTSNHSVVGSVIASPSGYASTSVNSVVSNTAGKTYLINPLSDAGSSYAADNFGADNPCILVDRRSNHFRAIYSLSPNYTALEGQPQTRPAGQMVLASGLLSDRCPATAALLPNVSGGLCAAAQHPTDPDFALLVYGGIGASHALKAAQSFDAGGTWAPLPDVLPALDLTLTGRPALCFLGDAAILVYSSGNALSAMTSHDRGQSWGAAATVSAYGPAASLNTYSAGAGGTFYAYYCLSLAAHGGQLFLLAFAGDTQADPNVRKFTSPRLFVSGDIGRAWTLRAAEVPGPYSAPAEFLGKLPGTLPAFAPPSGIGVSPFSGLLRLDTQHKSADGGLTWA